MECYFFISKNLERIDYNPILSLKKELDLIGLPKRKTSITGTTCIDILNNVNKIIYVLNHCINLTSEPFYKLTGYLRTELTKINKTISDIIVYELDNYFSVEINKIQKSQDNVKAIKKSLIEHENLLKNDDLYYEYYDKLIEDFQKMDDDYDIEMVKMLKQEKDNKTKGNEAICGIIEDLELDLKEALKDERNHEEIPELIKNYIQKMIANITNYKYYFDLYFGILDNNSFHGKNLDYFQATFCLEIEVPKFYIYSSFENYEYIHPLKNLFTKLAERELKETKILKDESVETLKSLSFDITKSLSANNQIIHCKLYEISSLKDVLNIYLNFFIENNIILKQCKNCGKYFIPSNRTDEVYCNRISPQNPNKTCKEYGAKKTYREEIKSTPIKYEHNKTSQFFRMRINRTSTDNTKEKEMYQKKFNTYKENYQKKKEQYKSGKLKEKDFVEWIIKQKEGVKSGSTRNNKK